MDLIDRLKALGERVSKTKEGVLTEEAAKNAFIMPFIAALGYDVFDPFEVIPEFTADVRGIKKGEKVDYCIQKDGAPIIIIECKHWNQPLKKYSSQLYRYFGVVHAKFGVLTNGIEYKFYTDLDAPNKMDERPFLEFSIEKINENTVNELKKFNKNTFNLEEILSSANDLKYSKQIKDILSAELANPSEEFVKYFAKKIYTGGIITKKIVEQFSELMKKSANNLFAEKINNRLQSAIETNVAPTFEEKEVEKENLIETTEEELQGFRIVQSILRTVIDSKRIKYRDTQSYFGVLLDDNNRKPICRLHFNRSQKYIGFFDDNKKETKHPIDSLDDIFNLGDELKNTIYRYEDRLDEIINKTPEKKIEVSEEVPEKVDNLSSITESKDLQANEELGNPHANQNTEGTIE